MAARRYPHHLASFSCRVPRFLFRSLLTGPPDSKHKQNHDEKRDQLCHVPSRQYGRAFEQRQYYRGPYRSETLLTDGRRVTFGEGTTLGS